MIIDFDSDELCEPEVMAAVGLDKGDADFLSCLQGIHDSESNWKDLDRLVLRLRQVAEDNGLKP